jgi:hypothetical protein
MPEIDAYTLRTVAELIRGRIARLPQNDAQDGMERLGAHRALTQIAKDLEVSADFAKPRRTRSPAGSRHK